MYNNYNSLMDVYIYISISVLVSVFMCVYCVN